MSHNGSGSSLSTPGSQIVPCTMGSEPDLTLYFYGSAKHKPPPTASYISQRWQHDCHPAALRSSSIFRKALSTSQAKFTYAYAWIEAKQTLEDQTQLAWGNIQCCDTAARLSRVSLAWTPGPWLPQLGAFTLPCVLPHNLPVHVLPKPHGIILLELLQRPKLSWIHQCRSLR